MGAQLTYLKQPVITKDVVDGHVPRRARFGACGMQGWRRGMEDAHLAVPDLLGDGRMSLFGVFDGHGGCGVARFAARHLPELLKATEAFKRADYAVALIDAFLAVDDRLLTPAGREELRDLDAPGRTKIPVSRKMMDLYSKNRLVPRPRKSSEQSSAPSSGGVDHADDDEDVLLDPGDFKEVSPESQGSTAVVALIVWGEQGDSSASNSRLIVANAGDSRCVLGRRGVADSVEAFAMSEDHKPELPGEAARIRAGGGHVQLMPGGARVNGDLNLSRSLGDFRHKQQQNVPPERQIVTAYPEVRECTLGQEKSLLILGCDGIWERNENQPLVERLHGALSSRSDGAKKLLLSTLGGEVCDAGLCPSMNPGENPTFDGSGCDNMTILILEFDDQADAVEKTSTQDEVVQAVEKTSAQDEVVQEKAVETSFPVSSLVEEVLDSVETMLDDDPTMSDDDTDDGSTTAEGGAAKPVDTAEIAGGVPAAKADLADASPALVPFRSPVAARGIVAASKSPLGDVAATSGETDPDSATGVLELEVIDEPQASAEAQVEPSVCSPSGSEGTSRTEDNTVGEVLADGSGVEHAQVSEASRAGVEQEPVPLEKATAKDTEEASAGDLEPEQKRRRLGA